MLFKKKKVASVAGSVVPDLMGQGLYFFLMTLLMLLMILLIYITYCLIFFILYTLVVPVVELILEHC